MYTCLEPINLVFIPAKWFQSFHQVKNQSSITQNSPHRTAAPHAWFPCPWEFASTEVHFSSHPNPQIWKFCAKRLAMNEFCIQMLLLPNLSRQGPFMQCLSPTCLCTLKCGKLVNSSTQHFSIEEKWRKKTQPQPKSVLVFVIAEINYWVRRRCRFWMGSERRKTQGVRMRSRMTSAPFSGIHCPESLTAWWERTLATPRDSPSCTSTRTCRPWTELALMLNPERN